MCPALALVVWGGTARTADARFYTYILATWQMGASTEATIKAQTYLLLLPSLRHRRASLGFASPIHAQLHNLAKAGQLNDIGVLLSLKGFGDVVSKSSPCWPVGKYTSRIGHEARHKQVSYDD